MTTRGALMFLHKRCAADTEATEKWAAVNLFCELSFTRVQHFSPSAHGSGGTTSGADSPRQTRALFFWNTSDEHMALFSVHF
jgi:hypothetical protein